MKIVKLIERNYPVKLLFQGQLVIFFYIFACQDWKYFLKFSKLQITFADCRLLHTTDGCLSIFVLYSLNFCPLTFCTEGEAWISTFFHTCNSILFKMGRNNFRKSISISQSSLWDMKNNHKNTVRYMKRWILHLLLKFCTGQ